MPYVASRPSPVTFSNERGPGAFAPLNSLPKRPTTKKSLFHIPSNDDDQDQQEPSPPPSPPHHAFSIPSSSHQRVIPPSVPFPSASLASPTSATPSKLSCPPIQRTPSATSVILSNGRPLKSSLKSASSSSIADDLASAIARHTRAQSMPSTPAFGHKNVHFKEKEDGLESVRLFRRTGKPVSVSKPTSDTETETEPEPTAYPFPHMSSNHFEIANSSTIPAPNPSPYANIHLESVTLPPARPPVIRGTILVRNIVFEKHVGVRFTLDDWTTVSEVLASYAGSVGVLESLAGTNQGKTVGDLIGSAVASGWDRFSFSIKLEDYESNLWQRTLYLVIRYSALGVGEWWDNNSGENYRITFRPYSGPTQPERKRGSSAPTIAPFLLSGSPSLSLPITSRVTAHEEPRPTFSPPQKPLAIPRSASLPIPAGLRLNLRHYAAPVPPARTGTLRVMFGGQPATPTPPETPTLTKKELSADKEEVDEGFVTGSEDGDTVEASPVARPQLSLTISPPSPVTVKEVSPASPTPSPPPRQHGPFSPVREPFSPRAGGGPGDSTYATLIREWCFAQGPDSLGASVTIGAQNAVPWVPMHAFAMCPVPQLR
ncbi:putative phosphatase regulatory subunit-domain-containing protein [Multifurca ochricompacta]|uniref:Phosphatase regulatory subunit-domain-containing protein n=1 Tax=Multifurca ochricompacta TaxID=376703 RepID=A0AAD4MDF8_9AGAM|nr:putative phosphatase regulatory subunit-domain-containing protein [Multifurca ochricompacta]